MSALIPDSKRQECLAKLEEAELEVKGHARSGRGRGSSVAAARAAAGAGGSPAAAKASSQPERSREEADRIAAQLLAEEEGERAKAQAAQAKKGKRARQKAQARAVEATVANEVAATAERELQEHQQEGLDAGASSSSNATAAAVPAADAGVGAAAAVPGTRQPLPFAPTADAAVQQLPGLSMGSAPSPAAPLLQQAASSYQPSQPAAPTAQQQQPSSTQGTSTTAAYEDDARLCVVCMEGQRCMVLVPCGHVVMCQECCAAVEAASNEVGGTVHGSAAQLLCAEQRSSLCESHICCFNLRTVRFQHLIAMAHFPPVAACSAPCAAPPSLWLSPLTCELQAAAANGSHLGRDITWLCSGWRLARPA